MWSLKEKIGCKFLKRITYEEIIFCCMFEEENVKKVLLLHSFPCTDILSTLEISSHMQKEDS